MWGNRILKNCNIGQYESYKHTNLTMNWQSLSWQNSSKFIDNNKDKLQSFIFISIIILLFLLTFNIFSLQKKSHAYDIILNQTKQKISLFLDEVTNTEKTINKRVVEDQEIKTQIFAKLTKKIKRLEKFVDEGGLQEMDELKKSKAELSIVERVELIQKTIWEQSVMLDLLQNQAKQIIRQQKISKFDELVQGDYFKPEKKRNPWILERFNLNTPYMTELQKQQISQELENEQNRLEETYHFSEYSTQIPFCIIIPSFNNAKNFRFQYNLQSIFNQDYSNYRVVIVDDNSSDNTTALIKHFLKKNKKLASKVVLVTNKKQMTAVPNIHMAIVKHCKPDQIGFFVDGDDELVGRKVFKVFNAIYQRKKPAVAYSISLQYWVYDNFVKDGWSKIYTEQQKAGNLYRDVPQKISHLRSFRIDLYNQIKQRDLKDANGQWFTSTYDEVICLPMLEMSCGNIQYIDDFFYLYVYGTGYNDRLVDSSLQWSIANYVKTKMPKYQCNKAFDKPDQ